MTRSGGSDPVVLVTGAGSGIGAATAARLVARGAQVACLDIDAARAGTVAAALGDAAFPLVADVTDPTALGEAVAAATRRFGRLDVCVANAGIGTAGSLRHLDAATVGRHLDVNVLGTFNTVRASVEPLRETKGYALLVASLAAILVAPGLGAYGASKAAVEALGNSFRAELAHLGVDVGVAYLSWVDTELVTGSEQVSPTFAAMRAGLPGPLRRTMPVDRAAAALVRAVEHRSTRVFAPRVLRAVAWSRGILGPVTARQLARMAAAVDAASADEFSGPPLTSRER